MATVVITGANRGIGLALARHYAARNDRVIATARTPAEAKDLAALAATAKGAVGVEALDVASDASLAAFARAMAREKIDILVCNAGMNAARGRLDDPAHTAELWARMFAINVAGAFLTVRAVAPSVIAANGKIAIISSRMGSSTAAAGSGYAYRASKAAVSNVAANLAVEMKGHGVAVASYHPGWVRTDMGGSGADIDTDTSARGLLAGIDKLSLATTGGFFNYDGAAIPF